MLKSAAQIISEKGGPAIVAAKVGKTAGAVRVWKHRDTFPREAWPEIMRAFPDLTLDVLMKLEAASNPVARVG
jgi:hypothetical protein